MTGLTVGQIAEITQGKLFGGGEDRAVTGAVIDSRKAAPGVMFCALPGERVDGHDYIAAALAAGADMINDVSCLRFPGMAETAAKYSASLCIMHDRRESRVPDLMTDKLTGLTAAAAKAVRAGVPSDRILLDGGIGFNRGAEEDRYLLEHYDLLSAAGYPLLLGASRKSFLGGEPETRLTATMECSAKAARMGVLFVRVHDVKENLMAVKAALSARRK